MEISEKYLTYNEYKGLGGTLDIMPFKILENKAGRELDLRTRNRLINLETIPEQIKLCMFDLINTLNKYETQESKNISSETVGSHSINYNNDNEKLENDKQVEIENIITTQLFGMIVDGEHILYIGGI